MRHNILTTGADTDHVKVVIHKVKLSNLRKFSTTLRTPCISWCKHQNSYNVLCLL